MRSTTRLMTLLAVTAVLTLAGVAAAQATPSKTSPCSNCHGGSTIAVTTALASASVGSSVYNVSAPGADRIAAFKGTSKVGMISGASGTFTLPVGSTYTVYAVRGPDTGDGLGTASVTPAVAPPVDVAAPPITAPVTAPVTPEVVAPQVTLLRQYAPRSIRKGRAFESFGYLKPRHQSGTYPVRIQCYRVEGGRLVLRKTVSAKASDYSSYTKYSRRLSLPRKGTWKIRAYHPAHGDHSASYSAYRTVKVR